MAAPKRRPGDHGHVKRLRRAYALARVLVGERAPTAPGHARAPAAPTNGRARNGRSALARLEAALGLVDDIDPALAADDAVVAMAAAQRLERVADFHDDLGPRPARNFFVGAYPCRRTGGHFAGICAGEKLRGP